MTLTTNDPAAVTGHAGQPLIEVRPPVFRLTVVAVSSVPHDDEEDGIVEERRSRL
jgi:hypothetical protein